MDVSAEVIMEAVAKVITNRKAKKEKEITTVIEKSDKTNVIIVPAGMTYLQASKELEAMHNNLEQVIDAQYKFESWEWKDVLVAIKKVTESQFGWIKGITEKTFFGEIRPKEIDIIVDIKNDVPVKEKCFYGKFGITAWENAEANVGVQSGSTFITIKLKKKYSEKATAYFNAIEQHLSANSIFKGKTVVVEGHRSEMGHNYDYEIIENKGGDHIILNPDTKSIVDNFVVGDLGEPGKKSYLFTGPYGDGKTETAMEVGRIANRDHGMTFFYVKDAALFDIVLNNCKKYQPCIIFLEDIDEIGAGEQRDAGMNKLLNTLDGVQTKGNDLTVIFTTNHEDRINAALRRPGRISQFVPFQNPLKETSVKIIKQYLRGLDGASTISYEKWAEKLGDVSASVVAEACKRARKLATRNGGKITDDFVEGAIISMSHQIRMMATPPAATPVEKQFVDLLKDVLFTKDVKEDFARVYNNS